MMQKAARTDQEGSLSLKHSRLGTATVVTDHGLRYQNWRGSGGACHHAKASVILDRFGLDARLGENLPLLRGCAGRGIVPSCAIRFQQRWLAASSRICCQGNHEL